MKHQTILLSFALTAAIAHGQPVTLQNATATFSQTSPGSYPASAMLNGNSSAGNGWAVFNGGVTSAQTAVFETTSNLTTTRLAITMPQNHTAVHLLGRLRISVTTDDRTQFADGLQQNGDVTANWTPLAPTRVGAPAVLRRSVLGDSSILFGGSVDVGTYVLVFDTPLINVTGIRLEAMEDPSLFNNGPGLQPNGNFVVSEFIANANPAMVSGQVSLNDFSGQVSGRKVTVEFIGRYQFETELDANGNWTVPAPPAGTYSVRVKASHWLSKVAAGVVVTSSGASGVLTSLINGDVDNDNEVGPGDFGDLATAFLSVDGDPNWNSEADLDGDGEVGPGDFGILANNFQLDGE